MGSNPVVGIGVYMLMCNNYKNYKATIPPTCNNGKGCQACNDRWAAVARAAARKLERIRKAPVAK